MEAAAAADTILPVIKIVVWLPRTIPVTIGIVVLLCTIHGLAGLEGDIESIRVKWGLDPGKPLSWFTHALLHTDNGHLTLNTFLVFLPSGGLVEIYLGRNKLSVVVLFTAVAAAVMAGIAVPEYWDTNSNPIGFSAVAQATFVIGVYIGGRVTTICLGRTLTALPMLKKSRDWPWSTFATLVGLTAAGVWLAWAIGVEWNGTDATPRVAHSFGMLTGAITTLLVVTSTENAGDLQLGKPLIGFAITVAVIATLAIILPHL